MRIFIFFLFSIFLVDECLTKNFNRKRILINGRPWYGFKPLFNLENYRGKRLATENLFDQVVNHFNNSDTSTFKQRYWLNNKWYKNGGPIFLIIGGESTESPTWIENDNLYWPMLAKKFGAMMLLIEHRYYGASHPVKNMKIENMYLLSSRQSIEDIAYFIKCMNKEMNLTSKWIVFGSSYSGALASWARQLHPDIIYGAVGSSSLVQATVDLYKYLGSIETSLSSYNERCSNDLKEGLMKVRNLLLSPAGQKQIETAFNLCDEWASLSNEDIVVFWQSIISNYMTVVQNNLNNLGDFRDTLTIKNLCSYHLDNSTTPLKNLENVFAWFEEQNGDFCTGTSYKMYIDFLRQTEFGEDSSDDRAWLYQTCTEFGFFQSTDHTSSNLWGNVINVDWYIKQCTDIFGPIVTNQTVFLGITGTNSFYGGSKDFKGTRVILPNGSNDPWQVVNILKQTNSQNYPFFINGTSHSADIYPPSPDDLISLTNARKEIMNKLNEWLA
uniref:Serine protease K12H4.7 n=1 Tax=Parastrongyloides trichosuri TaxID=131310 RepID=A0A0N4Z9D1_PARTI